MTRERVHTWPSISVRCEVCRRPPLRMHGREYLYRYDGTGPLLCGDACAKGTLHHTAPKPAPAVSPFAAALFRRADRTEPVSTVLLDRARGAGKVAVRRLMAETIIARAAGQGACTFSDLKASGFTPEELRCHLATAKSLAARLHPDLRGEGAAA